MAEFDELFTTLRGIARKGSTRLRIELEPAPQVAEKAAGLAMREIGCCSFFTFTLTAATGELQLDITVPATQAPILDALHTRATTAAGSPT
ncbi:hypothetical protein SAMN05421504_112175 [Amycolatopsis xylanica]|uniref:Uncharacterized protein n=1 Tax=Amycolatopsis xylanica TaxID=589385 RepID=A0A1H3S293_9PSEU|nr:hypothetical protein [Amycolatopsis xylanica]SDZ32032.1 hypothetical protein SAMN05421504_112175 [Amycolatopsis xylanica]